MLRLIEDDERPPEPAYRVPWHVDRARPPGVRIWNTSDETLQRVTATSLRTGRVLTCGATLVRPGEPLDLATGRLRDDSVVVLRWARPDGAEFVWRIVLL